MALQDNYSPVVTRGNGTTVNFSYSFDMIASTFAVVNLRAVATGVRTLQELNVDYTITVSENGGIVTMADAPTSDYDVIVERSVPAVQDVPYKTSTGFQGSVVERSFDKVVAVLQELLDVADRAVRTDVDGDEGLIFPNAEANKIIGWNADGDALENKDELDADTVASVQAFADAAANSAEEAEAAADIAVQAAADAIEAAELIADLEVASEAEAQAGTDNTKVTTPLRVFQGIAAYADANFLTTPEEAPDADYEVANKKYVDDKGFGAYETTDASQVGGTGATLAKNTVYQASVDGMVTIDAYKNASGGVYVQGISGQTSSPTAIRVSHYEHGTKGSHHRGGVTLPVSKNEYWEMKTDANTISIYFKPLS
jgi:hypothetical protein